MAVSEGFDMPHHKSILKLLEKLQQSLLPSLIEIDTNCSKITIFLESSSKLRDRKFRKERYKLY
jgi:hypothetical protein